jgi:ATP-dependent RNA helicase DHX57
LSYFGKIYMETFMISVATFWAIPPHAPSVLVCLFVVAPSFAHSSFILISMATSGMHLVEGGCRRRKEKREGREKEDSKGERGGKEERKEGEGRRERGREEGGRRREEGGRRREEGGRRREEGGRRREEGGGRREKGGGRHTV